MGEEFAARLQDDLYLRYMIADFYGASHKEVDNLINEIIKKRKNMVKKKTLDINKK